MNQSVNSLNTPAPPPSKISLVEKKILRQVTSVYQGFARICRQFKKSGPGIEVAYCVLKFPDYISFRFFYVYTVSIISDARGMQKKKCYN